MDRPAIDTIRSGEELKRWYWLKSEVVAFAKEKGLPYGGAKFEIIERIAVSIDGTNLPEPQAKVRSNSKRSKTSGTVDATPWHRRLLTLETVIDDKYTNGPATRRFFVEHCGPTFRFTIAFMAWMRNNCGRTLNDAIVEWERQREERADPGFQSAIPESNQYNRYLREFFADNPNATMQQARAAWKRKRSLPGPHRYAPEDMRT